MISRSTIAAAARVIEYAAARPIVLSADLTPPSKGVAQGAEAGSADGLGGIAAQVRFGAGCDGSLASPACHQVGVDSHCIADALEFVVGADVGAASVVASRMTRLSAGSPKNA